MRAKKSGIWDMGQSSGIWDIGVEIINTKFLIQNSHIVRLMELHYY